MNDNVIKIRNLSKVYNLYKCKKDRLREVLSLNKRTFHTAHSALEDVNIEIKKGEAVGIIGMNGSGKSTLLKIITGVLTQTSGEIKICGKVSAILELGIGFNVELTGIENIFFNGTINGLSNTEIRKSLDAIIDFADIGEYIYQPVKSYSSGMFSRLAFALAVNINPEILIVDEALSVGDMAFQEKSITKMKELLRNGVTVIFVSHSIPMIRNFCDRAIWLHNGKIQYDGKSEETCSLYTDFVNKKNKIELRKINQVSKNDKKIAIMSVSLEKRSFHIDEDINIHIIIDHRVKVEYGIGVIIRDSEGNLVSTINTVRDDINLDIVYSEVVLKLIDIDFAAGTYTIDVSICDELITFSYDLEENVETFEVLKKTNLLGIPSFDGLFRVKHQWVFK